MYDMQGAGRGHGRTNLMAYLAQQEALKSAREATKDKQDDNEQQDDNEKQDDKDKQDDNGKKEGE